MQQEVKLFEPTEPQVRALKVVHEDKPFITCLNYGRQTGKSYMALLDGIARGMNQDPDHPIFINFVVPTYSLAKKHMQKVDMLFQGFEDVKNKIFKNIKYKEQEYHFHNGTIMSFLSADSEDNLRGGTCHFMYIDEAAFIKETTYTEILLPMLTQTKGRVLMFSTPNGKNWFYRIWKQGQKRHPKYDSSRVISLRADYRDLKDSPNYEGILTVIMSLKDSMPTDAFNREVLAEFVSDQSLFTGVENATRSDEWYKGYRVIRNAYTNGVQISYKKSYAGIDIGVVDDYTVITIIDENNVVLDIDRFNMRADKLDHEQYKKRIKDFLMKHRKESNLQAAYFEINNKELLYDEIISDPDMYFVFDFRTSVQNKSSIVTKTITLFDKHKIRIPDYEELHEELYAFRSVQSPNSGVWTYRGSDGIHDDMVMSLCLAVECKDIEGSSGYTTTY